MASVRFTTGSLAKCVETIRSLSLSSYRIQHYADHFRRISWLPKRNEAACWTRKALGSDVIYPSVSFFQGQPTVCFLLTIAEFGGVETVTANVAMTLRNAGFRTALCMIGTRRITLLSGLETAFDEILWFPDDTLTMNTGKIYEGTHLPSEPTKHRANELIGLLSPFNAVISCHGGGSVSVLSALKRHGLVTGIYEHVLDRGPYGRTYGTPEVALAYENAVDFIVTCSDGLGNWFADHGVPDSKIIRVPNAAGYPLDSARLCNVQPRSAESAGPLRILFFGRFDRQKGIDRLVDVVERVSQESLNVAWRVHGKSIFDDEGADEVRLANLVEVLPPVTSVDSKTDLMTWADILLMPSRFEGLPLTILEAQRCGVVPLVARCGMVDEAIEDDVDGLLVSQENCVEEIMEDIRSLVIDRRRLHRLSRSALAKNIRWEDRLLPLIEVLRARLRSEGQRVFG